MNEAARAAFIRRETAPGTAPLVPEIRLHLASEVTALWQATEASLERDGLEPPFWAFAWPGGQALARLILDRPALVRGRRVLDFAAGCGIAAIAAHRSGAARVEASEIDPFAATALALNAGLNAAEVVVLARDVIEEAGAGWDVILAGDVCYARPMAERVIGFLRRAVAGGATVLLADPGRAYLPAEGLTLLAEYAVPTSRELEDRTTRETRIFGLLGEPRAPL